MLVDRECGWRSHVQSQSNLEPALNCDECPLSMSNQIRPTYLRLLEDVMQESAGIIELSVHSIGVLVGSWLICIKHLLSVFGSVWYMLGFGVED